ncbi:MAG: glycosyltransferase [Sedimentisphaerales bacterium]|nr:glycosyltransferase [Sedimentisphaerales bacterium]
MNRNLVVIPAYNEEETIEKVVTSALKYADVSVTDDGSRDSTSEILHEIRKECEAGKYSNQLNIITHLKSSHIPQGIQDGLRFGVESGYDFLVTMDAGLSHDPEMLPNFFQFDPTVDVVIGSRKDTKNVPLYRKAITKMAAMIVNYSLTDSYFKFTGLKLKDCTSGFRRYSRKAAELIAYSKLKSKAFDFHMEALALCMRKKMSAAEIPIVYVFSNSSFNEKVLLQGIEFGWYLLSTKSLSKNSNI